MLPLWRCLFHYISLLFWFHLVLKSVGAMEQLVLQQLELKSMFFARLLFTNFLALSLSLGPIFKANETVALVNALDKP